MNTKIYDEAYKVGYDIGFSIGKIYYSNNYIDKIKTKELEEKASLERENYKTDEEKLGFNEGLEDGMYYGRTQGNKVIVCKDDTLNSSGKTDSYNAGYNIGFSIGKIFYSNNYIDKIKTKEFKEQADLKKQSYTKDDKKLDFDNGFDDGEYDGRTKCKTKSY